MLFPIEKGITRLLGKQAKTEMTAKKYAFAVLSFSFLSFIAVMFFMLLQGYFPGNPNSVDGTSFSLAFNTAISFVTNTNWQAYVGEATLSPLTQMLALTVQHFVSAGVGIAVLFALLRWFVDHCSVL